MATATVIAITGQAWARDEDGNLRELRIGDVLQEGETLITSADGRVELDFADGTGANVVEGGQEVAVTPDLVSDLIVATDASAQDDDLEALLAALDDEEGDLLDILDATAAGGGAGGGGGGGSSFVRVARIAEETDPLSFSTEGGLEGAEFVEFDGGDVAAEDAGEGVVDTTPPTLTVDAPTGNDTTPIITGSSDEIGGTVSVIVTDSAGNTQELEAVVSPDGTWSVDVTTPLAEGDYTVDASITDPAGNGATASDSGAIDTTAPTLTVDAPSGNDTTPTIIGTSDQIGGTVSVIVTDAVGNSQELEATVNPDGTWSVDVTTPLSEGDYTVDASITDPAGNEATASDNGAIDTTAPNAPSVTIANGDDFITADEITNGQVTVTIGLENTNAVAGDTLTVNGTEITLTEEQIAAGEVVTELPTPAEGESLVVTATITDSSGNQSDEGVADAVRDTVAPTSDTTTLIIDDVTADNTVNADEADGEVTVTGRVTGEYAEGDVVTLTINGNDSYTTTVNAAGEWSVAVAGSDLATDADQTIDGVIAATDAAGNVGGVSAEKAYSVEDAPTIDTVTAAQGGDVTEGDAATFNVTLSNASTSAQTYTISLGKAGDTATAGDDYDDVLANATFTNGVTYANGEISVPAGVTAFDISVATVDDTIDEANESFTLTVGGVDAEATIIDNDDTPTLSITNPVIVEGTEHAVFTVSLSNPSSEDVTFDLSLLDGTAVVEKDYSGLEVSTDGGSNWQSGSEATIAAGQTSLLVRTSIVDDAKPEDRELFRLKAEVKAGTVANTDNSAQGEASIIDNDLTVALSIGEPEIHQYAINIENVNDETSRFDIAGYDTHGDSADISIVNGGSVIGFGVEGHATGDGRELGEGEKIVIEFKDGVTDVTLQYSWLSWVEQAKYVLKDVDGNVISEHIVTGKSDQIDPSFSASSEGQLIKTIELSAPGPDEGNKWSNDDYLINQITYVTGKTYDLTLQIDAGLDSQNVEEITSVLVTASLGAVLSHGEKVTPDNGDGGSVWKVPLNGGEGLSYTVAPATGVVTVNGLTVSVPASFKDNLEVSAVVEAVYGAGGEVGDVTTVGQDSVVVPQYQMQEGTIEPETLTGTNANDIVVGDVSGLKLIDGENYNIAFMVDTSGSMSQESVDAAESALKSVFATLKESADTENAGKVNVFLVDFDTQAGQSVSVDLSDSNALAQLQSVLDQMSSGGGTNYEDVFKTTANWFQSDTVKSNVGSDLTYFITDGLPTYYQSDEQEIVVVARHNNNSVTLNIDDITYMPGQAYSMKIGNVDRQVIDESGNVYLWTREGSSWSKSHRPIGKVLPEGDGTYEISVRDGDGSSTTDATIHNSKDAFKLLKTVSAVNAIGLGSNLDEESLQAYDSDAIVQNQVNSEDLAEAILGKSLELPSGNDVILGAKGDDILFGDQVTFDGNQGNGLSAIKEFVAGKLGEGESNPTTEQVHSYITEHVAEFVSSNPNGGDDTLIGGQGDDILFGGAGADTFKWKLNDQGSTEQPATDTVIDFNTGENDKLDIAELLVGYDDDGEDSDFVFAEQDGNDTVLYINSQGELDGDKDKADQIVRLEGKSISDFADPNEDVIKAMIEAGQLKIDQ